MKSSKLRSLTFCIFAVAVFELAGTTSAQRVQLTSNFLIQGSGTCNISFGTWGGVSFTTDAENWTLNRVVIKTDPIVTLDNNSGFALGLYENDGGLPGDLIFDFIGPPFINGGAVAFPAPVGGITLEPHTQYFVIGRVESGGSVFAWRRVTSTAQDGLGEIGDRFVLSSNQGGSWMITNDLPIFLRVDVTEPVNQSPTADAGPDQSIRAGDTVLLDGSASFDDNTAGALLDYDWSFSSKPAASNATLADATSVMPSFVADVAGTYRLQLIVTDEEGAASDPGFVEISSDNLAPTAAATVQSGLVVIGDVVQLDGTDSSDPEMDPLTYSWSITAAPATSTAVLVGAGTATATLTPDVEGVYEVTLTVSDFLGPGAPTLVELTAITASGFAEIVILDACDQVSALTAGQVTTKGNQNAFCKHLANAIGDLQEGLVDDAIDKLNKAIGRTDGCTLRGSPDGNGPGRDWITDCNVQADIYELLNLVVGTLED